MTESQNSSNFFLKDAKCLNLPFLTFLSCYFFALVNFAISLICQKSLQHIWLRITELNLFFNCVLNTVFNYFSFFTQKNCKFDMSKVKGFMIVLILTRISAKSSEWAVWMRISRTSQEFASVSEQEAESPSHL